MLRPCWCFICGIFYVTAVDLRISKHQGNERSVNVALDTVLEFDNKDNVADIKFLDNVQKFIGKVKTVIEKKSMLRRNYISSQNERFTEFVLNLIQILNQYNDTDLQEFFALATNEMRKYHYQGCKFHELTENYNLRKLMASQLAKIKSAPTTVMRHKLESLATKIEEEKYNVHEKDLIDYINSLYGESSNTMFHKILSSLDDYRIKSRKDMDLFTIINKGIRSVLFDYYTNLNRNARIELKIKLDDYCKNIMETSLSTDTNVKNIEIITTTNGTTSKIQYVKQYVDLKHSTAHNYGRWKPEKKKNNGKTTFTARSHTAHNFKNANSIYRVNLRTRKRKIHAEIFNKQQEQIHSKKPKTDLMKDIIFRNAQASTKKAKFYAVTQWYSKESFEKNDPYAHEHSKVDAKVRGEIAPPFHPINSLLVHDFSNIDLNSNEHKKIRSRTPKEPDIISTENKHEENRNHRITKSKLRKQFSIEPFEPSLTNKPGKYANKKITKIKSRISDIASKDSERPLVTAHYLTTSIERDFYGNEHQKHKDRVEDTMSKQKLKPHLEKSKPNLYHTLGYNSDIELRHKNPTTTSKYIGTYSYEEESPLQKLERIKKQNRDFLKNNKSVIIEHRTTPTMGTDSVEFIAFEDNDLGGIDKNLKINQDVKLKSKLLNNKTTIRSTKEKRHHRHRGSYHQRSKDKKLTFLTLYPEFIHKWSTRHAQTPTQRTHRTTKEAGVNRVSEVLESNKMPDMSLINMAPHIPQALMKIINHSNSSNGHTTTRKAAPKITHAMDLDMSLINIAPHMPAKLKDIINPKYSEHTQNHQMSFKSHKKHTKKSKHKHKIANSDSKQEKEKKTNHRESHEKNLQLNAKLLDRVSSSAKNRSNLVSSDRSHSTEESIEDKPLRTFHRRMDTDKRDRLFIDVNVIPQEKTSKPFDTQTRMKSKFNENNHYPITEEAFIRKADNRNKQWTSSYKNQLKSNNNNYVNTDNSHLNQPSVSDKQKSNTTKNKKIFIDLKYPDIVTKPISNVKYEQKTLDDMEPKYDHQQRGKTDSNLNSFDYTQDWSQEVSTKMEDPVTEYVNKPINIEENKEYKASNYRNQSETGTSKYHTEVSNNVVSKVYNIDNNRLDVTTRIVADNNERNDDQKPHLEENKKYNVPKTNEAIERRAPLIFRVDEASDKDIKTDPATMKPSVHSKAITVQSTKNTETTHPAVNNIIEENKSQNRDTVKDVKSHKESTIKDSITSINVQNNGELRLTNSQTLDNRNSVTPKSVESQKSTNSTKPMNATSVIKI